MGWFSNITKNLRPDKVFSNPERLGQMMLDPAGSIVRGGRGQDMPNNARSLLDPGGFFTPGATPAAPNSYRPQGGLNLSPGAQQLYDQMKARSAARLAGQQQQQAGARLANAPTIAPQGMMGSVLAQMQQQQRQRVAAAKAPQAVTGYADGGKVTKHGADACFETKVFTRKPNGKPY